MKVNNRVKVLSWIAVQNRFEELESELEALEEAVHDAKQAVNLVALDLEEAERKFRRGVTKNDTQLMLKEASLESAQGALREAEEDLKAWKEDRGQELEDLRALIDEACEARDWAYGETLIHEDYFTEYVKELCVDVGYLAKDFPAWIVIDWAATAENVKADYMPVFFGDATYYIRG